MNKEEALGLNAPIRLTIIFALLSALTALAWWLGAKHGEAPFHPDRTITLIVCGSALLKVWFIIQEFMEVRHAPRTIRWSIQLWFVATAAVLYSIYYLG